MFAGLSEECCEAVHGTPCRFVITATSKSENTETSIGGPHTDGIDTRNNQEEADTRTTGNDDIDTCSRA